MKKFLIPVLLLLAGTLFAQTAVVSLIGPEQIEGGETFELTVVYQLEKGFHQTSGSPFFVVEIDSPFLTAGTIRYPEGEEWEGRVEVILPLTVSMEAPEGSLESLLTAGYQLCNDQGTCFAPASVEIPVSFTVSAVEVSAGIGSVLFYLLLAFVGGMLLNIMPCVLPLLSIKALALVNQSGDSRKSLLLNSAAYTLGIEASLLLLGLIVILVKASGQLIGWGFQFQNPGFVLVLTSLIFVFALSLFDVFTFEAPGIAAPARGRKGLTGNFITGIFAVLVATPCTAPFLGAALGFAFSQPPLIILLIFLVLGLGFALPFVLLGFFPGIIKKLPRPGAWMDTFKELMGFLLLATVISLLHVYYKQAGGEAMISVLIYLTVLGFLFWGMGKLAPPTTPHKRKRLIVLATLILAVGSAWFLLPRGEEMERVEDSESLSYAEPFSEELLKNYLDQGEPVFVDFYAQWCTTCKLNHATVLSSSEIENFFSENGIHVLAGDFTESDPVIARRISLYGKGGVPVYAYYAPGNKEPEILPELLTRRMILELPVR